MGVLGCQFPQWCALGCENAPVWGCCCQFRQVVGAWLRTGSWTCPYGGVGLPIPAVVGAWLRTGSWTRPYGGVGLPIPGDVAGRVPRSMRSFDLLIIGAGSGNSVIGPEHDDWDIAIAEHGLFGGTCLNVGCIPSKMFVYAAEVAALAADSERLGIRTSFDGADWPAVRDRIFGRIDPIAEGGLDLPAGSAQRDRLHRQQPASWGPARWRSATRPSPRSGSWWRREPGPPFPDVDGAGRLRLPHLRHHHAARRPPRAPAGAGRGLHRGRARVGDGRLRIAGDLRAAGRHLPAARGRRDPQPVHRRLQPPLRRSHEHPDTGRSPGRPGSSRSRCRTSEGSRTRAASRRAAGGHRSDTQRRPAGGGRGRHRHRLSRLCGHRRSAPDLRRGRVGAGRHHQPGPAQACRQP